MGGCGSITTEFRFFLGQFHPLAIQASLSIESGTKFNASANTLDAGRQMVSNATTPTQIAINLTLTRKTAGAGRGTR